MSITELNKMSSGGGSREPLPNSEYDAVVHAIIDLGNHVKYFKGEAKPAAPMVKFLFEIPDAEADGSSRIVGYKEMKVSTHEKSALMELLRTLFAANTTDEVLHHLDKSSKENESALKALLGKAVKLKLSMFTTKDGQDIQYVSEVLALDPRIEAPEATEEAFMFSLTGEDAPEVYKTKLAKFTQDRVADAENASQFSAPLQQAIAEVLENREDSVENKVLG